MGTEATGIESRGVELAAWVERDILIVDGADAAKFLQGQVSQDVEAMADGSSGWTLVLNPAGKVVAWARVHRTGPERFLVELETGSAGTVMARLNRFRIRVACEIHAGDARHLLIVRGGAVGAELVEAVRRAAPGALIGAPAGATTGVEGFDALLETAAERAAVDEALLAAGGPRPGSPGSYEGWRIRHRIPKQDAELDESVIPAEIGSWFVGEAASFTKGCYVGQELVARVDSRGTAPPFSLRLLELGGPAAPGDEVTDAGGRKVGVVSSADGDVALARLARSVVPPTEVTVHSGGSAASVAAVAAHVAE